MFYVAQRNLTVVILDEFNFVSQIIQLVQLQVTEYLIQVKDNKFCSDLKISTHFIIIAVPFTYSIVKK